MHSEEDNDAGKRWFAEYTEKLDSGSVVKPRRPEKYRCPCCCFRTIECRGGFDICQVCYWEDDGQDNHDADDVRGGPNGALSLSVARQNYRKIGACHERFLNCVRKPNDDEA